jgi:dolichol kinase
MNPEIYRQFVHLGGLLFIILAQYIDKTVSALYFLVISAFFLVYSEYVKREASRLSLLSRMESRIRGVALTLERKPVRPFMGAFWFYFSCGIAFLIFPLVIASAACAILAIGDALATIAGNKIGRHRIIGNKTLEGSVAFFAGSFLISFYFLGFYMAAFASVIAAIVELVPAAKPLKKLKEKHIIDDNWMIPILTGAAMFLIF